LNGHLTKLNSNRVIPNYAVELTSGESITHNPFVVPDWGALRFDLHTDDVSSISLNTLTVTLQIVGGRSITQPIYLREAIGTASEYANDRWRIGYGETGFETFTIDVPDEFRGKVATVSFELSGGNPVYLDNVFFKSQHLLFGNPTPLNQADETRKEARADALNFANAYLLEKSQYALSYNNSTRSLNWVSYQLNSSWLGSVTRLPNSSFISDETLPPDFYRVRPVGDLIENRASDGKRYTRGHMVAQGDRSRIDKDAQATYLMTNMIAQESGNNSGVWNRVEIWAQELAKSGKELYVIAGGDGQRATLTASDGSPIRVPSHLWKAFLILEQPGQNPLDVQPDAIAFAFYVPNSESVAQTDWFDMQNLRNIDWLETQIGYNLFANIPASAGAVIEGRDVADIQRWIINNDPTITSPSSFLMADSESVDVM
jgi:DNA/RNA endonuclease G (NUC1)